jgi:hypothetical protein
MGLMDKIKEMFGGGHGETGERAGQQAEPGQDTSQYQSGQAGQQYDADADAFGSVTSRSGQPGDTQYQQTEDTGQYQSDQYQSGTDADAFGDTGSRAGQPEDPQVQQAESDMESEGGHEWER